MLTDLARRCLLPGDAEEAEAIVTLLSRNGSAVTRYDGDTLIGAALLSAGHKHPSAGHLDLLAGRSGAPAARAWPARCWPRSSRRLRQRGLAERQGDRQRPRPTPGPASTSVIPQPFARLTRSATRAPAYGVEHDRCRCPCAGPRAHDRRPTSPSRRARGEADLAALLAVVAAQWGPSWVAEVDARRPAVPPRAARRRADRVRRLGWLPSELVRPDGHAARRDRARASAGCCCAAACDDQAALG